MLLVNPNSESKKVEFARDSIGASVASMKFAFAVLAFSIPDDVACKSLYDVFQEFLSRKLGKNAYVHTPPEIAVEELLAQQSYLKMCWRAP